MAGEVTGMNADGVDIFGSSKNEFACVTIDAKLRTTGLSNTTVFMEAL